MSCSLLAIGILILSSVSPAWADFETGAAAFHAEDYATALRELKPYAENGNADAQFVLGMIYGNGMGVPQDDAEAARWYRLAAQQGHEKAQSNLALMYAEGLGISQDLVLAHMWWSVAAEPPVGHLTNTTALESRNRIAKKMTDTQIAEAQKLYYEWKYFRDLPMDIFLNPNDVALPLPKLRQLAEQGQANARLTLAVIYAKGRHVRAAHAQETLQWFRLAAEQGDSRAKFFLGLMHNIGLGIPRDYTEAVRWYRLAAEQENVDAHVKLGSMYFVGQGVPQNQAEAIRWLDRAAEKGTVRTKYEVGQMYASGKYAPLDYAKAGKWLRQAADQRYPNAQNKLGEMYSRGLGITLDYHQAVKLYQLAAEQGLALAQYNLGSAYAEGHGVPKDLVQAHSWLTRAWGSGNISDPELPQEQAIQRLTQLRDKIAKQMTPAQLAESERLTEEWRKKTLGKQLGGMPPMKQ